MRIAFTLFHYFPYGGLERDMLTMARTCAARGHEVIIYTQSWAGDRPADIPVVILATRGLTNHGRARAFVQQFLAIREQETLDLVVGFNKMPGLDVYYAADVCFAQKAYEERGWWYRLSGRSRQYLALEEAVFGPASQCQILMISQAQIPVFQRYYATSPSRFHLLPPGINRNRIMPGDYATRRKALRESYGLREEDLLLLMVGSDFQRKGVARAIQAAAALPEPLKSRTRLWVAGTGKTRAFTELARKLGVGQQLAMLGARDDVSELMWSADMFLHPAYSENTGTVLLEAMVAGLPVIATDVCGYAPYIVGNQQGLVLSPAEADTQLGKAIAEVAAQEPHYWRERATLFAGRTDIFSMMEQAVDIIEDVGSGKSASMPAG